MRFMRAAGIVFMVIGALALLACAAIWLLPQTSWSFTDGWLDAVAAAVDAPSETTAVQWAQAVGRFYLRSQLNSLYLSAGVFLLGFSVLLIGRGSSRADREGAHRPRLPEDHVPRPDTAWRQATDAPSYDEYPDESTEMAFMPPIQYSAPVYDGSDIAVSAAPATMPNADVLLDLPRSPREAPDRTVAARAENAPAQREEEIVCPVCHTLNSARAYYCHHCKSDLPETAPAPPTARRTPDPAATEAPRPLHISNIQATRSLQDAPAGDDTMPTSPKAADPQADPQESAPPAPEETEIAHELYRPIEAQPACPAETARKPLSAPSLEARPDYSRNEMLTPSRLSPRIISTVGVKR